MFDAKNVYIFIVDGLMVVHHDGIDNTLVIWRCCLMYLASSRLSSMAKITAFMFKIPVASAFWRMGLFNFLKSFKALLLALSQKYHNPYHDQYDHQIMCRGCCYF